jgi:hypothetical protein
MRAIRHTCLIKFGVEKKLVLINIINFEMLFLNLPFMAFATIRFS